MCLKAPCVKASGAQKKFKKNTFPGLLFRKAVPDRQEKPRKKNAGKREKKKPLETQADQGLCPDRAVPFFHIGQKEKPRNDSSGSDLERRTAGTDGRQARTEGRHATTTAGRTARKAGTPTAGRTARRAVPIRPDRQDRRTEKALDRRTRGRNAPRARLMEGTQKAVSR